MSTPGMKPPPPAGPPGAPAGRPAPFRADPARGRLFQMSRVVRSTDVTPAGRLRFDALARYLQEAAEDDLAGTGLAEPYTWLLRRAAVQVRGYPARGDGVRLRTFCSGTGPRWAERTTTLAGPPGDLIQVTAVWVAVGRADGAPMPLTDGFRQHYGPSAAGREVSARLVLPAPAAGAEGRPWPLRATDFDMAGHVNNSIHWAAVEDVLTGLGWVPVMAEMEYHRPVLPGEQPRLAAAPGEGRMSVWLCAGPRRLASAVLHAPPLAGAAGG